MPQVNGRVALSADRAGVEHKALVAEGTRKWRLLEVESVAVETVTKSRLRPLAGRKLVIYHCHKSLMDRGMTHLHVFASHSPYTPSLFSLSSLRERYLQKCVKCVISDVSAFLPMLYGDTKVSCDAPIEHVSPPPNGYVVVITATALV